MDWQGQSCVLLLLLSAIKGSDNQCGLLGDLRLVNGANRTEGRLDICRNDIWGGVCYEDTDAGKHFFSLASASVACFQLGFAGAVAWYTNGRFGRGTEDAWLKQVNCSGEETKLDQCGVWCTNEVSCGYCDHYDYNVGISCTATWQVQLVHNDVTSYRGTVYHYYNGTWGILCDEGWSFESATVVCNQLGLGKAVSNFTSSFPGHLMENFLMTNTNCRGQEHFLKDCPNEFWQINQTYSGQHVAGVICEGPTLNVTAISSTSTSISLKWVATDDRVYYYSADISYSVLYFMNNISYILTHDAEYITVTGLQPDTEYTFFIEAGIIDDYMLGPVGNVTYRTQAAGLSLRDLVTIVLPIALALIAIICFGMICAGFCTIRKQHQQIQVLRQQLGRGGNEEGCVPCREEEAQGRVENGQVRGEDAQGRGGDAQGIREDAQGRREDAQGRGEDAQGREEEAQGRGENGQGRGGDAQGRREDAQGRREDDQGRGEDDQGRGEDVQGRGEDAQGRGEDAQGRREDAQGRREDDQGRGEDAQGRGEDVQGRGEDAQGRGEDAQGRKEDGARVESGLRAEKGNELIDVLDISSGNSKDEEKQPLLPQRRHETM